MRQASRVLLVTDVFPPLPRGAGVVYSNLARCAGGRIVVVAPRVNHLEGLPVIGWREHDRQQPYRVIRLPLLQAPTHAMPSRGLGKLLFLARDAAIRLRVAIALLWLLASGDVRTVCVGGVLAGSWVIRLVRLAGVRTLAFVQDGDDRCHDAPALHALDRVIVASEDAQRAMRGVMGDRGTPAVSLLRNGVDAARFHPLAKSPDLLDLYRMEGCFVFLTVCRLTARKGVDQAIRAFARVAAQYPDCRYLVVGAGEYGAALQTLARHEGVADKVVFAGAVPAAELPEHYQLADVLVMPNRELADGATEGLALAFMEANGCGLPVIAGRDGGSADVVQDGVNGLVVDGRSIEAIAAAMERLHQDAGLRIALGERGRAMAAKADWAETTRVFLGLCLDEPVTIAAAGAAHPQPQRVRSSADRPAAKG